MLTIYLDDNGIIYTVLSEHLCTIYVNKIVKHVDWQNISY